MFNVLDFIDFSSHNAGPSAPRSVAVRVGYNSEVCATWAPPALPVGTVILYKLYAEAVENSEEAVDVVDLPSNTAVKVGTCIQVIIMLCSCIPH